MIRIFNIHFSTRTILAAIGDVVASSLIVFSVFYLPLLPHHPGKHSILSAYSGLLFLFFWLWVLYTLDLYDAHLLRSPRIYLQRTAIGLGIISFASVLLLNIFRDQHLPAGRLEILIVLFAVMSVGVRWCMDWGYKYFGFGERLLVLGTEANTEAVKRAIEDNPHFQVQALGLHELILSTPVRREAMYSLANSASRIERLVDIYRPHRIVISQETLLDESTAQSLLYSRSRGVSINTVDDFFSLAQSKAPIDSLKASALMYGGPFHKTCITQFINRLINMLFSSVLLVICFPFCIAIAVAIVLESRGPVFYSQERVGFRGQTFRVIKFRSMRSDAELDSGPTWASKNDPRITRVGAILRKLRFDEIPQLWNVLLGEMNLVGPRPERPHFVEILRQHIPFYDLRHSVRPGITGWAQVMAAYGDSIESSRLKVEYDIFYLRRASLSLDMYILFRTIKIALSGRGAQ